MKITTENIQVGFHARQILKGISMESQDKELVGIIGPNGSGKSTLLKFINSMLYGISKNKRGKKFMKN